MNFQINYLLQNEGPLKQKVTVVKKFISLFFQNFWTVKNKHRYSSFTDKGPSIAERVIKTIRIYIKKPVLPKGNADW